MSNHVILEKAEGIAWIILNKPEKKNAIDSAMMDEITAVVRSIDLDDEVRVAVLKGAGNCFCAGGDLSGKTRSDSNAKTPVEVGRASIGRFGKTVTAIQECDKPIIAMVEGFAIGGGFSLALACDVILAADTAKFSSNFLHVGLAPEMGAMLFLPLTCGMYVAKDLWYSGRRVEAEEGNRLGFVSRVFSADTIEEETLKYAKSIVALPSVSTRIMKKITNSNIFDQLSSILVADMQDSPLCLQSDEALEYLKNNFKKK